MHVGRSHSDASSRRHESKKVSEGLTAHSTASATLPPCQTTEPPARPSGEGPAGGSAFCFGEESRMRRAYAEAGPPAKSAEGGKRANLAWLRVFPAGCRSHTTPRRLYDAVGSTWGEIVFRGERNPLRCTYLYLTTRAEQIVSQRGASVCAPRLRHLEHPAQRRVNTGGLNRPCGDRSLLMGAGDGGSCPCLAVGLDLGF